MAPRRVTFKGSSKIHEIPLSRNDAWISHRELTELRKDMLRAFEHAKKYGIKDGDNFCLRGMESLLNNGLSAGRRRLARRAVLQSQSMNDPEFLSRIYKNYCSSSLEAARSKAEKDEQAVLIFRKQDEAAPYCNEVSCRAA